MKIFVVSTCIFLDFYGIVISGLLFMIIYVSCFAFCIRVRLVAWLVVSQSYVSGGKDGWQAICFKNNKQVEYADVG